MSSRRRAAGLALGLGVVLLLSGALAFAFLFYRPLPTTDGEQRLVGLEERAEVARDGYGVPHITARTAHDLFFLQGYVTAQDRLVQLELLRLAARGELATLLGEPALGADRFTRSLGLRGAAARDDALLSDEARAALAAFAAGVNKYLDQRGDALPAELVLLGHRPERWEPADSLAILKLWSFDLAPDLAAPLARANVAARGGPELLGLLFPGPPPSGLADGSWAAIRDAFAAPVGLAGPAALDAVLGERASGLGGSCIAVSGRRSASGAPLLAADPHLPVRDLAAWYEVALHGGGYDVAGLALPGLPGIVLGHNTQVAWSFIRADIAVRQLVIERPDPADPSRYRTAAGAAAATVRHEEIAVRGRSAPVGLNVAVTAHGPILGDAAAGTALALRWTGLDGGRSLDGILGLDRATDLASHRRAAAQLAGPALRSCYADRDGHIATLAVGPPADPAAGDAQLPVPGWTEAADRPLSAPAALATARTDPATGVVAVVFDQPAGARSADPALEDGGLRSAVVAARLRDLGPATAAGVAGLQTDPSSPAVPAFRAALLAAQPRTAAGARAQALVRVWDGGLVTDSAAAAVYEAWVVHFAARTFGDVLGAAGYRDYLAAGVAEAALHALLGRGDDPWSGSLGDPGARGRDAVAGLALDDAAVDLGARLGPDPAGWRWGALHQLRLAGPLAERLGPLAGLFVQGPFERPGDGWSLNDGGFDLARPFAVRSHAGIRLVLDLGDPDGSLAVLPPGESGQPLAAHQADQLPLWLRGELRPMPFQRERVAGDTLVLRPR